MDDLFDCLWADQQIVFVGALGQEAEYLLTHEYIQEPPLRSLSDGGQEEETCARLHLRETLPEEARLVIHMLDHL